MLLIKKSEMNSDIFSEIDDVVAFQIVFQLETIKLILQKHFPSSYGYIWRGFFICNSSIDVVIQHVA